MAARGLDIRYWIKDVGCWIKDIKSAIKNGAGFTLIELVIVISIIGALAAGSYGTILSPDVKQRTGDANRMRDLEQIRTALTLYYQDHNCFPATAGANPDNTFINALANGTEWTENGSVYMKKIPKDPRGTSSYSYMTDVSVSGRACPQYISLFSKLDKAPTKITACPLPTYASSGAAASACVPGLAWDSTANQIKPDWGCITAGTVTCNAPTSSTAPTVSLSANPTNITAGGNTTLTWSSNNATSCTASNGWSGSLGPSGSRIISNIASTTTYTITCSGNGSANQSVVVTVGAISGKPPTCFPAGDNTYGYGDVNASGGIDNADVTLANTFLNQSVSNSQMRRADVDTPYDTITNADITALNNFIGVNNTPLPICSFVPTATPTIVPTPILAQVGWWKMDDAGTTVTDSSGNGNNGSITGLSPTSNLVGHWKMDEGTGILSQDFSGNGNVAELAPNLIDWFRFEDTQPGTAYNSSRWGNQGTVVGTLSVGGAEGCCSRYFGGADYIWIPALDTSDFTKGFTVSLWAYPTAASNNAKFMSLADNIPSNNITFGRYGTTDDLFCYFVNPVNGSVVAQAQSALIINQWHRYTCTIDGAGTVTIYRDKTPLKSQISTPATPIPNVTRNINIGRSTAGDSYYTGYMDDVHVYNRAISQGEIDALTDLNHTGAAWWNVGKFASTANLNGTSDFLNAGNGSSLNLPNNTAVTMCAWVYSNTGATGAWQGILAKRLGTVSPPMAYGMNFMTNSFQVYSSNSVIPFAYNLPATTWTHICGVIGASGSPDQLYVNGALIGTSGPQLGVAANTANLNIGASGPNGEYFNGLMDDVRIYNTVLSAAQIQALSSAYPAWTTDRLVGTGALNFYGGGVTIPDSPSLRVSSYSVSLWFYATQQNEVYKGLFGKGFWNGSYNRNYNIWLGNAMDPAGGYIYHVFHDGSGGNHICGNANQNSIAWNSWHHVVITNDGRTCKTYVDSILQAQAQVSGQLVIDQAPTYIGANLDGNPGNNYSGTIDDIRMYNYPLSQTEVTNLYNQSQVGWWKFENNTNDSSGNNLNGTVTGGGSSYQTGASGQGISLNGTTSWVDLGQNKDIARNRAAITMAAWMKSNSTASQSIFETSIASGPCGNQSCANSRASLSYSSTAPGEVTCLARSTDTEVAKALTTIGSGIATGQWYHVACVINYTANTITIYVNGVQKASWAPGFAGLRTPDTADASSAIGSQDNGSAAYFNGMLDDVKVYNHALSPKEIAAIANATCTFGYIDTDGEGYGAGPYGCYTSSNVVQNSLDCYDLNANAYPGQPQYFSTTRGTVGQGNDSSGNTWNSYDWNCSKPPPQGTPYEKQFSNKGPTAPTCTAATVDADCGAAGNYGTGGSTCNISTNLACH